LIGSADAGWVALHGFPLRFQAKAGSALPIGVYLLVAR
jgi:hypothetical protein